MRHDVLLPALLQHPSLFLSVASAAADPHCRNLGDIEFDIGCGFDLQRLCG
jgi:hypothetical protein